MKKLFQALVLGAALLFGSQAKAAGPIHLLTPSEVDPVTSLQFIFWGTNHYSIPPWWNNVLDTDGHGYTNLDGGALTNWAAWRAVNADLLFLQNRIRAATNGYPWLVFSDPAGAAAVAAQAATNGYLWGVLYDPAGRAQAATNGFPWGVLYDPAGAAAGAGTAATNGYPWGVLYDPAGRAQAATNGFPWLILSDPAGTAQAATNGYPWGALYDPAGRAQAATNGFPWLVLSDPAGAAQAATNGYPWGGLYDPLGRAQAATNGYPWGALYLNPASSLNASNLSGIVQILNLGYSGTANSSTFLRGDGTWSPVTGASATNVFHSFVTNGTQIGILTNGTDLTYQFFIPPSTFDLFGAATSAAQAATNGYPWGTLYDPAGRAQAATNGYLWGALYDPAGAARNATNGYPWGALYDPAGAAQAATNGFPWGALYLAKTGGNVSGAVTSTSPTTNGPANNELVTAGWTRGLFNVGAAYYAGTNIDATATNLGSGQPLYQFSSVIPLPSVRTYTKADFLTNSAYVGSVITTNTFPSLGGSIVVNAYLGFTFSGGTPALTIHPEIYYSYDRTNWYGDYSAGAQSITPGATNLYQWLVDFPRYTATNANGFYIQRRFKIDSIDATGGGGATRSFFFFIGTNLVSGATDASHITTQSPSATTGNAYLVANQTFTGVNTFTQPIVGQTSLTNAIVYTNSMLQTINFGNVSYVEGNFSTNAAFAWLGFIGIDATKYQTAVVWVTNSSGSPITVSMPANCHFRGETSVTNVGEFVFKCNGNRWTNCFGLGLW